MKTKLELQRENNGLKIMLQREQEMSELLQKEIERISVTPIPVEMTVWVGTMPESNGKTNHTVILHRVGQSIMDGITIHVSEYPGRAAYEADELRYLIGELENEPCILEYDTDFKTEIAK